MKPTTSAKVRIELFGGPRVRLNDDSVVTFQAKPATVLALLSLAPGNRLTRDELSETIWPDEDPSVTRARLRTALAALRSAIPCGRQLIPSHSHVVSLNRSIGVTIDFEEFESSLVRSRAAEDPRLAIAAMERMLTIGADRFAPGIYAEPVIRAAGRVDMNLEEAKKRLSQLRAEAATVSCPENTTDERRRDSSSNRTIHPLPSPARFARLGVLMVFAALAVAILWWTRVHALVSGRSVPVSQRLRILDEVRYMGPRQETPDERKQRRSRQAEQCLALAEQAWRSWYGPDEQRWIGILKPIDGDLQNSLRWLINHDATSAVRLAGFLYPYWDAQGKRCDARRWLEQTMQPFPRGDSADLARAMAAHAMCCMESTAMERPEARRANAAGLKELQEAYAMYVRMNDSTGQEQSLRCLGHFYLSLFRWADAEKSFNRALQMFRDDGNKAGEAYTLWGLSLVNHPAWPRAARTMRDARLRLSSEQMFRQVRNERLLSFVFSELSHGIDSIVDQPDLASSSDFRPVLTAYLGECRLWLDGPEATNSASETLAVRRRIARVGVSIHEWNSVVEQLGFILAGWRDIRGARAIRLYGAYIHYCGQLPNPPISRSEAVASAYGEAKSHPEYHLNVSALLAQGQHMSLPDAVILASR